MRKDIRNKGKNMSKARGLERARPAQAGGLITGVSRR